MNGLLGRLIGVLLFSIVGGSMGLGSQEQATISRVEQLPNLPQPFQMRDWWQVTQDYLNFLGQTELTNQHLPVLKWPKEAPARLVLPSYVGSEGGPEGINFMAAVVSGGLTGKDMRSFSGRDWVAACTNYFNVRHGVCNNDWGGGSGSTFWYDLLPNVLFFQVCALYPNDATREGMLFRVAESWYRGCLALGAATNGSALPCFDHLSLNLESGKPVDNGRWTEPEGAAGVAWCEYMAWTKFQDPRFLIAADWALRALLEYPREKNPLYEVLLPYAALTAARMNASLDRNYDVAKLLDWCFEPSPRPAARPWWGVLADRFGDLDCHGLVGSSRDTDGYAFAMNTFQWAGALAPLARYDTRYARAMGKWLLNLGNASRLFYANALPASQQDHREWADGYDLKYCLAYEGLRKHPRGAAWPQPYATGDAHGSRSNVLNFCLYGSSHVGILGGLLGRTSEPCIPKIDLLRTDYFHEKAYPTYLIYNPHTDTRRVTAEFGPELCDLYEAVSDRVLKRKALGQTVVKLPPDTAMVMVVLPPGAVLQREGARVTANGVTVKWR